MYSFQNDFKCPLTCPNSTGALATAESDNNKKYLKFSWKINPRAPLLPDLSQSRFLECSERDPAAGRVGCNVLAFCRLKDVQSMDELKDVYNHFLLYYGRDIPKMQNAAKAARKKQKRIREDGEEEEGLSPRI